MIFGIIVIILIAVAFGYVIGINSRKPQVQKNLLDRYTELVLEANRHWDTDVARALRMMEAADTLLTIKGLSTGEKNEKTA